MRNDLETGTTIEPGARPSEPGDQLVFRTGVLFEADFVAAALEEAGIPFYQRTVMPDGQQVPSIGGRGGPGQTLLTLVPAGAAEGAREIIEGLPLDEPDEEEGVWAVEPRPGVKRLYKLVAGVFVALFALWMVYSIALLLGGLFS